jgi:hypothetical protein
MREYVRERDSVFDRVQRRFFVLLAGKLIEMIPDVFLFPTMDEGVHIRGVIHMIIKPSVSYFGPRFTNG